MVILKKLLFAGILSLLPWVVTSSNAQGTNSAPVILELYTSQSCSSCPPADRLFGELIDNPNIIGVTCHVDYWDHLHWKDTLSLKACTDRQRQRARYIEKGRTYTPNLVINGRTSMVGSKSTKIKREIQNATAQNNFFKLKTSVNKNTNTVRIDYPNADTSKKYSISLFALQDNHTQAIPSGENRGRSVDYRKSALMVSNLLDWNGTSKTDTLEVSLPRGTSEVLILVNDKETGFIEGYSNLVL